MIDQTVTVQRVARVEIHTMQQHGSKVMNLHVLDSDGYYLMKIELVAEGHMDWPIYFDSDRK